MELLASRVKIQIETLLESKLMKNILLLQRQGLNMKIKLIALSLITITMIAMMALVPAPKLVLSHVCTNGVIHFIANNVDNPVDYGQVNFTGSVDGVALFDKHTGNAIHYTGNVGPVDEFEIVSATVTIDGLVLSLHNPGVFQAISCNPTAVRIVEFRATPISWFLSLFR